MRIVAGSLKGRIIPFSKRLGDVRVTSGRVKEAVFSMLGADLHGRLFLDLFAGSGQIGLEAVSRGARAVMCEPDARRHKAIQQLLQTFGIGDEVTLHRVRAERAVEQLEGAGARFDVIYVDPPYRQTVEDEPTVVWFLRRIGQGRLVAPGGVLIAQHDRRITLPAAEGCLSAVRSKAYGDSRLAVYGTDPAGRTGVDCWRERD